MSYDAVFSPGTSNEAAINNMVVVRRQELQTEISNWEARKNAEIHAISLKQQQVERERQVVRQREFSVMTEQDKLNSQGRDLENGRAMLLQGQHHLAARVQEFERLENLRRRNRTVSEAYVEDSFAALSPQGVVQNLTNASIRVKEHAKRNISNGISGSTTTEHFVSLDPKSIAPYILPKLHQLVSTREKPIFADIEFAEYVVASPAMAKALSLGGHCGHLAEFLVEQDHAVSRLAICGLRQMSKMETSVVVPAYTAIANTLPQIPVPNPFSGATHPSVGFIVDVASKIVDDCFNNQRWNTISPLATHRIESIRRVVLQTVLFQAQRNERVREGLVKARTLELLDRYYQLPAPPADVLDLYVGIIPLLAERICQDASLVPWLLRRLNDTSPQIQTSTIEAIRNCAMGGDAVIQQVFVEVELLRRLNDPATEPSVAVTKLICALIPTLAVLHARSARSFHITAFLEHPVPAVSSACLIGCRKILESSPEHRADLLSAFLKLDLNKETTLQLADVALPVFCRDWVARGDFPQVAKYIKHGERRVRDPAQKAWSDAVSSSPKNCEKIAKSGLLGVSFVLCNSSQPDSMATGWQVLPYMAIEVSKAGVGPTRDLVNLIHHPRLEMRRAVLQSLQTIAEGGAENCEQLLIADAFNAMTISTKKNPNDGPEFFEKVLVCMSPSLSESQDACSSLLQLLDSDLPRVNAAALNCLTTIASYGLGRRQALRRAMLEHLPVSSDTVVVFIAKAISEWLGTDLAQSDDFQAFFELASNSNKQIQNAALLSLKQKLGNPSYQDALERAQVASFLRSLCSSNNPDAITFVVAALPALALTLARNQHTGLLLQLLALDIPAIKEGTSSAIQVIACSPNDKELLLNEDILEKLVVGHSTLDHPTLKLAVALIPNLAINYVAQDRVDVLLALVNHHEQPIREAIATAFVTLSNGSKPHKVTLRDTLITRLNGASSILIEVISSCLSRAIAHDLAEEKKYDILFQLLQHNDFRIRSPVAAELRVFIQKSDEPIRIALVAAGILKAALDRESYDDLVLLLEECILPLLGPAFSQHNGGQNIVPLLTHNDIRLRTAAFTCLRNAVDSPHGNLQNMTKRGIVTDIHPKIRERESVRTLWCHILPKVAPLLSNRAEIDIVFDCLSDQSESVRDASKQAISVMARASDITRQFLYPTITSRLDDVSDYNVDSLSLAVALSGVNFLSNGHELKLVSTISHDNLTLATSAIDATIDLITGGDPTARQKLMEADVFAVALQLRRDAARDKVSVKLLLAILDKLSGDILQRKQRNLSLILLFDDPNQSLSQALYTSLSADSKLVMTADFPELLPSLLSGDRIGNQFVSKLLIALSESIIRRLLALKRVDLIIETLEVNDSAVAGEFFSGIHNVALSAGDNAKNELATDLGFVSILGRHLKSQDSSMRRLASEVIDALSTDSSSRSEKMMQAGIGESLAWIAVNGESNSQCAAILALLALFLAAPDHADRLVAESLPNLCRILEDTHRTLNVYDAALRFLSEMVNRSPHRLIIESGILKHVTSWINPQFSMSNPKCLQEAFRILLVVSQNSEEGRQSVIEAGILPMLLRHAKGREVGNVVNACNVVVAILHTGTFRQAVVDAGIKKVMEDMTGLFHKSTLANKADKKLAQDHARRVLSALKSTKDVVSAAAPAVISTATPASATPASATLNDHINSLVTRVSTIRRSASERAPPTEFGGSAYQPEDEEAIRAPPMHGRSATEPSDTAMSFSRKLSTVQEKSRSGTDSPTFKLD